RENVVEGVRVRDRAVVAPVVDDWGEEGEREDQRPLVVEAVDGGVVRGSEPDEEVLGLCGQEPGQELLEARVRVLRLAAAAGVEIRELDRVHVHGSGNCRAIRASSPRYSHK